MRRQPGTGGAAPPRPAAELDAIVLAGGRGRRLGDPGKPGLLVGGWPLVSWVVAAAAGAGAGRVVLVGPRRPQAEAGQLPGGQQPPPGGVVSVREQPPGSGPVPALRRGLAEVTAPVVAVLAADLPFLRPRQLRLLLAAAGPSGAVLTDGTGHPQWLAGCWRAAPLRAALAAYRGDSLRGVLRPLQPRLVRYDLRAGEPPPWLDCDTPDDVRRAREWQAAAGAPERTLTGEDGSP